MYNTYMDDLYYLHKDTVKTVPYSRDRALSVSPIFYPTKRQALIELKHRIEAKVQDGVEKLMSIEKELAEVK